MAKVWRFLTAVPRFVAYLCAQIGAFFAWIGQNLSDLCAAFHSVFRLERLFWSFIYAVLGVGGYTVYTWIITFTSGMDWAIRVIKE